MCTCMCVGEGIEEGRRRGKEKGGGGGGRERGEADKVRGRIGLVGCV